MTVQKPESQNVSGRHAPPPAQPPHTGRQSRPLLIMFLAFFILVALVFIFQRTDTIDWEDYDTGIKLAEKQNKPVLLAFYKEFAPMSTDTRRNTYTHHDVIDYVHRNFIPILINVDEQPEITKQYNIGYYPTHYIKSPDSNEIFGPLIGYDPPAVFIKKLKDLLDKMNPPDK